MQAKRAACANVGPGQTGLREGFVNVLSRHTTTAVTINENEARLLDDVRQVGGLPVVHLHTLAHKQAPSRVPAARCPDPAAIAAPRWLQFLHKLAPPAAPYLHNDLHLRPAPENWPGGHPAWAQQEPQNAHSHLLSMVLGNTSTVPVTGGKLALGTWQSVLLVELDGPRPRTVGIQLVGQTAGGGGSAAPAAA